MLRGRRLAPASVYLCLVCLLVQGARPAAHLCAQSLLRRVQGLILKAPQQEELGSLLYTPSSADYESRLGFTLKCFGEELKVLLDEWKTSGFKTKFSGSGLKTNIEELAVTLNLTEAEDLRCERLNENTAEKFLSELEQTFVKINSGFTCQ